MAARVTMLCEHWFLFFIPGTLVRITLGPGILSIGGQDLRPSLRTPRLLVQLRGLQFLSFGATAQRRLSSWHISCEGESAADSLRRNKVTDSLLLSLGHLQRPVTFLFSAHRS